jgi:hypothetical protein
MCLVTRLVLLANKQGHCLPVVTEGWSADPLMVSASFLISTAYETHSFVTGICDAD